MSLANAAANGAAKLFGAQAVRVLVQAVGVVVLSRLVSPEDFGLFVMVAAVANVAVVLGDFGLSAAAIQSQEISKTQRSNLFWTNAALGVVLSASVLLLAPALASFYQQDEIVPIMQVLSATFLVNALAAQFRAEMSRSLRFGALAVVDAVGPIAALAVAITAALQGAGYWALVAQPVTLSAITLLLLVATARWAPGMPGRAPMRHLYTFGLGTLGMQLTTYVSTNIDDVLIGRYWGPAQAGIYSRAFQLFRLPMQQIAVPVARVALPVLSRLQNDNERFAAYVLRGQLLLAYLFGGIFYLLAAISSPVIDIALGPGWGEAKPLFFALAIGGVFQSITTGYWWVFQAKAMVMFALRFSIMGRLAMIGLLFAGVPWGAMGVAWASAAGQAIMWFLYTTFAIHRAGLSRKALALQAATPVICGLVATAASFTVTTTAQPLGSVLQLILGFITFVLAVGVQCLVVRRLREDLATVLSTVRRALPGRHGRGETSA